MADLITLTFTKPLNASCQVGDTAYYVNTAGGDVGGFTSNTASPIEIGQIREISGTHAAPIVKCATDIGYATISSGFILFSKDNKANLSSMLGYYAEVKLVNDSTSAAELFSVAMDAFESSK